VLEAYTDGAPQDSNTSFLRGDLVLNAFNDDRQARLYLKDEALDLRLLDPDGREMDACGDGGAAFAGGPDGGAARSMQRADDPGDGRDPASWHASRATEGGSWVNPAIMVPGTDTTYRDVILATPGEPEP
jgi:hypothetical protein